MDDIAYIRDALTRRGIQQTELANEAGMSRATMRFVFKDTWNPTVKTLRNLRSGVDRIVERRA